MTLSPFHSEVSFKSLKYKKFRSLNIVLIRYELNTAVTCVCLQLLNAQLAEEKLGIDGSGALFPVSQVYSKIYFHTAVFAAICR